MTQAISENTQLSNQDWRKHTDPPGLWIAVVITSILLHLLAIWLIKFSGGNLLGKKSYTSVIPIELVEVNPAKQRAKSVSRTRKSPVTSTKQIATNNPPARSSQKNSDSGAIAIAENNKKQSTKKTRPAKRYRRESPFTFPTRTKTVVQKPQATQSNKPENTNSPKPQPREQREQPSNNTRTQQPQPREQREQPSNNTRTQQPQPREQREQPSNNTRTQQPTQPVPSNTPNTGNGNKPWEGKRENIELGRGEKLPDKPLTPSQPSPSTEQTGGLILRVKPLSRNDVIALTTGEQKIDPPPDNMAVYTGSPESNLDITILSSYPALQSAQILASLVINQKGQFEQVIVLEIKPQESASKKSQYQDFLNTHFRNQKFLPGYNNNGTKPEVSNLVLNITIEQQQKQPNLPGSMLENQ